MHKSVGSKQTLVQILEFFLRRFISACLAEECFIEGRQVVCQQPRKFQLRGFVQLKRIHVSRFRSSECKVEGLRLRKVVALAFPLLAMFEVGQPIVWEQPHAVKWCYTDICGSRVCRVFRASLQRQRDPFQHGGGRGLSGS